MTPITNLHNIVPKKTTFKKIFKHAYRYGFSSQYCDTPYYQQIEQFNRYTSIERNTVISQCYVSFDMNDILYMTPSKQIKQMMSKQVEFIENGTLFVQPMCDYLSERMSKRETISITMSYENYLFDVEEQTHVTHSAFIILHPSRSHCRSYSHSRYRSLKKNAKNNYDMFYVNSHGNAMYYTNFHIKSQSIRNNDASSLNMRVTLSKTTYKTPIDFIVTNLLMKTLNKYHKDYDVNTYVHYDTTHKYNYLGINLQSHDNHGVCFIFPILFNVILHTNYNKYFIKEYKTISNNKTRKYFMQQTVQQLLETKNITLFVYHALAEIEPKINDYLAKYYCNIEKQNRKTKQNKITKQNNTLKLKLNQSNNYQTSNSEDLYDELYDAIDEHLDNCTHRFIKKTLTKTMHFVKQDWNVAK